MNRHVVRWEASKAKKDTSSPCVILLFSRAR